MKVNQLIAASLLDPQNAHLYFNNELLLLNYNTKYLSGTLNQQLTWATYINTRKKNNTK